MTKILWSFTLFLTSPIQPVSKTYGVSPLNMKRLCPLPHLYCDCRGPARRPFSPGACSGLRLASPLLLLPSFTLSNLAARGMLLQHKSSCHSLLGTPGNIPSLPSQTQVLEPPAGPRVGASTLPRVPPAALLLSLDTAGGLLRCRLAIPSTWDILLAGFRSVSTSFSLVSAQTSLPPLPRFLVLICRPCFILLGCTYNPEGFVFC